MSYSKQQLGAILDATARIMYEPSNHRTVVYVTTRNRAILEQLQAKFGGTIRGNRWTTRGGIKVRRLLRFWWDSSQNRNTEIDEALTKMREQTEWQ